ncbi:coenzyme Q-binding protein COQ10 homolog A, mitochondrial-like [Sycon ciliatum]|uniref:coenzyme Q-binding protein COQ10 homolog A, mitochondrial-like n=1 Tax=Sycon ciliatum TaxID=27933 RepID=UPI0031F6E71A
MAGRLLWTRCACRAVHSAHTAPTTSSTRTIQARSAMGFPGIPSLPSFFPSGQKEIHFSEQKILGYTPEQVYSVVSNVNSYCHFVPWCRASKVLSHSGATGTAELVVGFPPVLEKYTSQLTLKEPSLVKAVSADSRLFKSLESTWHISASPSGSTKHAHIHFEISFEFVSSFHSNLSRLFFDEVAKQMVSAFEKRLARVYGPSLLPPSTKETKL